MTVPPPAAPAPQSVLGEESGRVPARFRDENGRRRQVSWSAAARLALAIVGLPALLTASISWGTARDRSSLPAAGEAARLSTVAAAAVVSCFEGVQDEFPPEAYRDRPAVTLAAARSRLATCDLGNLRSTIGHVHLGTASPLATSARRRAREDLDRALADLRRVLLDAEGTRRAMARDIAGPTDGSAVVLGYRATAAGYQEAAALVTEAQALLRH